MFGKKNIENEYIEIRDRTLLHRIAVKRSKRKTISLSIKRDGSPVIHCPNYTFARTLKKVAKDNIAWVSTKVEEMRIRGGKSIATYEDTTSVLFMGEDIILHTGLFSQKEEIRLESNGFYIKAGNPIDVRLSIKAFYRKQAKQLFRQRTDYWLPKIQFASTDTKIIIKSMITRWGSMSSTGRMNLNIALMRTPIECIDYVIVHELCHQKHPHHQPPFWAEVAGIMADYKKWEKILKSYSTEDF